MRWVKASERMPTRSDGDFDGDVIVRWCRGPSWLVEYAVWDGVGHHEEWLEGAFTDVKPSPNGRGNHSVGPDYSTLGGAE